MSREQLEKIAFETIRSNMEFINNTDEEIWAEIKKATDEQIECFLEEIED